MGANDQPLVAVGIDGTPAAEAAIRYAALEAGRLGAALRLVHVCPDYAPTTPMLPMIRDDFEQVADRILRQGSALVRELAPGCRVTVARRTGPTVPTLLALAEGASLLVIGRDHRSRWGSVFTGSTSTGVAGRAACPLVSVPQQWEGTVRGQVAVGVRSAATAAQLLEEAFAAAESRGARLVVLRAWQLPGAYDEVVAARSHPGARDREIEEQLDPLLEERRARHPGVPVELSVVHQQPAHALLRVAARSDLLLVLRAAHGLPFVAHLGGTGRTVLHQAACPVEVVPPVEVLARVRVGSRRESA
jgi:nucleotide-binding universal stress UspA family protein